MDGNETRPLAERIDCGQCPFEKILEHRASPRREEAEFLFGYTRFLQERDGVTPAKDFLRVAFGYQLRYRDCVTDVAVFVESRGAIPDDEARCSNDGRELRDRVGSDINDFIPLLDLARLFHFCLLVFPLDRDVDGADKLRIGNDFFFGSMLGDARTAADGVSLYTQDVVCYRTDNAHMIVGRKEGTDEGIFRFEFCAPDDGKCRVLGMQRFGKMTDLVAHDESRIRRE